MRSINKYLLFLAVLSALLLCSSCGGRKMLSFDHPYDDYYEKNHRNETEQTGMAEDLAVISKEDQTDPDYQSEDYADLLINDDKKEVITSYHCFDKLYPASITKVMTALLTMEYIESGKGSWDDEITLDHNVILNDAQAVASTLSSGDTVKVSEVFHTLLIKSANDCAVILAEYVSGSEEKFVQKMNRKAKKLGATHTHFMNTNGLHDDDHYTTAYDLYLIFREAAKRSVFVDTVSMQDYTMVYTNSRGTNVSEYMESTNHYLLNEYPVPEGVTMFGGKTGTTSLAKSCLILMTENKAGNRFFSIVLGAPNKEELYQSMTALLEKIPN